MPIVINPKSGLQTKRGDQITKEDVVLSYSSPEAKRLSVQELNKLRARGGYTNAEASLSELPRLSTLEEAKTSASVISAAPQYSDKKLDSTSEKLRDNILKIRTQQLRGEINAKQQAQLAALASAKTIIENIRSARDAPKTAKLLYRSTEEIKNLEDLKEYNKKIGQTIREEGARFGTLIKESPTEAVAVVGTEVLLSYGLGAAKRAGVNTLKKSLKIAFKNSKILGGKIKVLIKTPNGAKVITIPNISIKNIKRIQSAIKKLAVIDYKTKQRIKQTFKNLTTQRPGTINLSKEVKNNLDEILKEIKRIRNIRELTRYNNLQKIRQRVINRVTKLRLDRLKYRFRQTRGRKYTREELKLLEKEIKNNVTNEVLKYKLPTITSRYKKLVKLVSQRRKILTGKITGGIKSTSKRTIRSIKRFSDNIKPRLQTKQLKKLEDKIIKIKAAKAANKTKRIMELRRNFKNRLLKRELDRAKYTFRRTYGRKLTKPEIRKIKNVLDNKLTARINKYQLPTLRQKAARFARIKIRLNKKLKIPSVNKIQRPTLKSRLNRLKAKTYNISNKKIRLSSDFIKKPIKSYIKTKRTIRLKNLERIVTKRATKRYLDRAKYIFRRDYGRKLNKLELRKLEKRISAGVINDLKRLYKLKEAKISRRMLKEFQKAGVKRYYKGRLRPLYRTRFKQPSFKLKIKKPGQRPIIIDTTLKDFKVIKKVPKKQGIFQVIKKKNGRTIKIVRPESSNVPRGKIAVRARNGQVLILDKPKQLLRKPYGKAENLLNSARLGGTKFIDELLTGVTYASLLSGRYLSGLSPRQRANLRISISPAQGQRQPSLTKQNERVIQLSGFGITPASAQRQALNQKIIQKQITKQKLKPIPKKRITLIPGKRKGQFIKSRRKLTLGYNVYGKAGRKFIKLNKLPLLKKDALSRGAYAIDNSTSKTLKIIPIGKTRVLGKIKPKEKRYHSKVSKKFRGYRITRGTKYVLRRKFIEKRRYGIDTYGEKRGLTLARLAKREGYVKRLRRSKR